VLIISHDRWFIDQCCDRVIEIHDCTCDFYNGNYSYYAVERERRREEQLKHHEHELAEKKRLEATARSMHEHGTEHLAKRAASIEKRIARMKVTDRPKTDKKMTVTFGDPNYETEEVLKVRDITKSYDGREILHNVSFNIRNRERVALLGANGAGKTTTLRILASVIKADEGQVCLDGADITGNLMDYRRHIGFLTSELKLEDYFTPNYLFDYFSKLYGVGEEQAAQRKKELFEKFGIDKFAEVKVADMSTGMKQKISLVISIVHNPDIIIFDEPTNGLDVITERIVVNFLKELREQGKCIIISSHIFSLIEKICDRVVIIIRGKSMCCDTLENVMAGQPLEDRFFELYENMEGKADE